MQMKVELITKDGLESFNKELFEEIRRNRFHFKKTDEAPKEWLKVKFPPY